MFAAERRGEVPEGTAERWAHETPVIKRLPEWVRKKEASWSVSDLVKIAIFNPALIARRVGWGRLRVAHPIAAVTAAASPEVLSTAMARLYRRAIATAEAKARQLGRGGGAKEVSHWRRAYERYLAQAKGSLPGVQTPAAFMSTVDMVAKRQPLGRTAEGILARRTPPAGLKPF